ncbi:hypothetical protein HNQ79_006044 [Streptomyces candidus]|uniref:Uncharacterized protein n=1 Tax=Streptomyces candidus TaxID=67283 RepID=A0A7X0HKT7_9ACTN|nr:hypothetical protein [Streptomyces candidus]
MKGRSRTTFTSFTNRSIRSPVKVSTHKASARNTQRPQGRCPHGGLLQQLLDRAGLASLAFEVPAMMRSG